MIVRHRERYLVSGCVPRKAYSFVALVIGVTMEQYKGKCKCSCGKRAKWRAIDGNHSLYACHDHKSRLEGRHKPDDNEHITDADWQTWGNL